MFPSRDKHLILIAMAASLVLHSGIFAALRLAPLSTPVEEAFAVALVDRLPDPRPPTQPEAKEAETIQPAKKQIVSPSQAPEMPPPENTTRISERDSSTPKEQVRRGNNGSAAITPPVKENTKPEKPRATFTPKVEEKSATPSRQPSLRLRTGEILTKLGTGERESGKERESEALSQPDPSRSRLAEKRLSELETESTNSRSAAKSPSQKLDNYTPFGRSSLRNSLAGVPGTSDYLPELPDGDITLLNAKANAYAVFVRRVALQVFGALRTQSWATLPYSEVQKLRDFSVIEAIMDRSGKLERIRVQDSSGSTLFDNVVEAAARKGTWDQNPPPGAALEDGRFHFAFHARTWARPAIDARGEQRWLLLGTELK